MFTLNLNKNNSLKNRNWINNWQIQYIAAMITQIKMLTETLFKLLSKINCLQKNMYNGVMRSNGHKHIHSNSNNQTNDTKQRVHEDSFSMLPRLLRSITVAA